MNRLCKRFAEIDLTHDPDIDDLSTQCNNMTFHPIAMGYPRLDEYNSYSLMVVNNGIVQGFNIDRDWTMGQVRQFINQTLHIKANVLYSECDTRFYDFEPVERFVEHEYQTVTVYVSKHI